MITYKDCPECGAQKIHSTVRLCEVCETCERYESKLDALRAEVEMLRGVGCREAKADGRNEGRCDVSIATTRARAAAKRAVNYRKIIRSMDETRRLNLEELWHEATREPYDNHDIDDVCAAIEDLRWTVDCIKDVLSHLSDDARNEYYRVLDALLVGKRPGNGTP